MEIPIELFSMGIGLSIIMIALGICKNIPMVVIIAGGIMFFIFTLTDEISRGAIPQSINDSGVITWIENPIIFTVEIKIMFILISTMIMLIGGVMQFGSVEKEEKE